VSYRAVNHHRKPSDVSAGNGISIRQLFVRYSCIRALCFHRHERVLHSFVCRQVQNLFEEPLFHQSCLFVALLYIGKGSLSSALVQQPYNFLLLLPLSGCLGFVTAKEAFCFKLIEGYLLAVIMPLYLLLVSSNILSGRSASNGLVLIAVLLVIFTLRKAFMPIAYDIGDKSAYQ